MRRTAGSLGLVAVLLAACGGGPDEPDPVVVTATTPAVPTPPPTTGVALPVRVTRASVPDPSVAEVEGWLGPPPGEGATPLEQVTRRLRYETLMRAGVRAPTTARCAGDRMSLAAGARTRCTVTYQGVPVPWTVTISADEADNSGAVDIFGYTVDTDRYVVRADVVRAEAWRVWGGYGEPTRCARMPAVQVLPAGRTRDRRQHLVDGAWRTVPLTVLDGGSVYFID